MTASAASIDPKACSRNLVLITFDQWRGDWCDPEAPIVDLPNIFGLARDGWSARCYASSPQCVPARLGWTTGLPASRFGVTTHRNIDVPPDVPSIVRELRDAGWWTELVGKSHLTAHVKGRDLRDESRRMCDLGFERVLEIAGPRGLRHVECALTDAWRDAGVFDAQRADLERRYGGGREPESWAVRPTILPLELYPDIWLRHRAEERLAALPSDRPWLLWISFVGPHEPFDTPPPWAGRHQDADLPPATTEPRWFGRLPRRSSARQSRARWDRLTTDAIAACRRDYADQLQLLDDQIGHLVAAIDRREDADRTAIAITADHGELLGDGGLLYKGTFLEGAVRVPWIYRPSLAEGRDAPLRTTTPIEITPLLRRCFDALAASPTQTDVRSWAVPEEPVVCEFGDELMLVSGDRKLVTRRGRPDWATDLATDPTERRNVITDDRWTWWTDAAWRALRRRGRLEWKRRRRSDWRLEDLEDVA